MTRTIDERHVTDQLHFLRALITGDHVVLVASKRLEAFWGRTLRALVDFSISVAKLDGDISNLFSLLLDGLINSH